MESLLNKILEISITLPDGEVVKQLCKWEWTFEDHNVIGAVDYLHLITVGQNYTGVMYFATIYPYFDDNGCNYTGSYTTRTGTSVEVGNFGGDTDTAMQDVFNAFKAYWEKGITPPNPKAYPAAVASVIRYMMAGNTVDMNGIEIAMSEDGMVGHAVTVNGEPSVNTAIDIPLNMFLKFVRELPEGVKIGIAANNVLSRGISHSSRKRRDPDYHPPV